MAAIGFTVAAGMGLLPRAFLRIFGIPARDVSGAAAFGWRLFAVRTAYISAKAWQGDDSAQRSFLPIQVLDQVVFWPAFFDRSVPRRASVMAAATSAAIIALDVVRRTAGNDRR